MSAWVLKDGEYPQIEGIDKAQPFSYTEPYPKWMWRISEGDYPYLAPLTNSGEFPSEKYKVAISKPIRQTKITGAITIDDTVMVNIENDIIKSLSKCNNCMNSDLLLPGAANAAEFGLDIKLPSGWSAEFFYGTRISLSFWLKLEDGTWEECPLGAFTPAEVTQSTPGFVNIIGYDDMAKLKNISIDDLGTEVDYTYFNTPATWLKAISALSGIPLAQTYDELYALPNGDCEIMLHNFGDIETLWDALENICRLTNCFAFINRYGKLELCELKAKKADREIKANMRFFESFSAVDYQTHSLSTSVTYHSGDYGIYSYTAQSDTAGGVECELPEIRPLSRMSTGTSAPQSVLNNIYNSLKTAVFRPFETEICEDPSLEIGDWVRFVGLDGSEIVSPITSYRWTWRSNHTLSACGMDTVTGTVKSRLEKKSQAQTKEFIADIIEAEAKSINSWNDLSQYTWEEAARFTWNQLGG